MIITTAAVTMCYNWISFVILYREISQVNKGRKMLEKMGWKKGEGLGKEGTGRKDPVRHLVRMQVLRTMKLCWCSPFFSPCRLNWKSGRPSQVWAPVPPCLWTACPSANQSPRRTGRKHARGLQMFSSPMLRHLKTQTTRLRKPGSEPTTNMRSPNRTPRVEVSRDSVIIPNVRD